MKKIIAGLVVIVAAAGIIKVVSINNEKPVEQEEIVQSEKEDVTDYLYEDTLAEENTNENDNENDNDNKIEEGIQNETQVDVENDTEDSNKTSSNQVDSNKEGNSTSGEYQGFADDNFVEIKVGDAYGVYKVSGDIKTKLNSKNIGQTINFTYIESAGQRVITSIN